MRWCALWGGCLAQRAPSWRQVCRSAALSSAVDPPVPFRRPPPAGLPLQSLLSASSAFRVSLHSAAGREVRALSPTATLVIQQSAADDEAAVDASGGADTGGGGLSAGDIAGIAIGATAGAAVLAWVALARWRRGKQRIDGSDDGGAPAEPSASIDIEMSSLSPGDSASVPGPGPAPAAPGGATAAAAGPSNRAPLATCVLRAGAGAGGGSGGGPSAAALTHPPARPCLRPCSTWPAVLHGHHAAQPAAA